MQPCATRPERKKQTKIWVTGFLLANQWWNLFQDPFWRDFWTQNATIFRRKIHLGIPKDPVAFASHLKNATVDKHLPSFWVVKTYSGHPESWTQPDSSQILRPPRCAMNAKWRHFSWRKRGVFLSWAPQEWIRRFSRKDWRNCRCDILVTVEFGYFIDHSKLDEIVWVVCSEEQMIKEWVIFHDKWQANGQLDRERLEH